MFCFRTGIYTDHDPGDQCNVFCYQWRILLSASSGDEDQGQQRRNRKNDLSDTDEADDSEKISADIRSYMAASVDHGTSRTSKVQGYSSGGKTGTAEKLPRGNGKYLVSFIGFAPVDDPALVIYVVVDEPKVDDQASSTYAQYIAQGILSEALPYLNVQPDEAEDGEVPTTELWELFKGISDSATGTGADGQKEAISDENVPSPPEDESEDSDTEDNNDMQSEGLTNEEAGLE